MSEIRLEALRDYLRAIYGKEVEVVNVSAIGEPIDTEKALKGYGYGTPLKIDLNIGKKTETLVFHTIKPGGFGHDMMPDRAAILLWEARAFNTIPNHVKALDVGAIIVDGSMKTLGDIKEPFLLTEFVTGTNYSEDLNRIKETGVATQLDHSRVKKMARYLSEIHSEKRDDPGFYERRNRELIGHNECIFGLTDSYPKDHEWIKPEMLADIEKRCIDWRWRNKVKTHRLSKVHGDFHPFNILFRNGTDFTALDRSRGEYGEPADDLAGLSINYIFWSLLYSGEFVSPFKDLWETFYSTYLEETGDEEVLGVIQPYLTWRALVVASPVWYNIDEKVRKRLLNFACNILESTVFNWRSVEPLLEEWM